MFDFDTVIERKGTDSLKYDFARERGKEEDVLPLWVLCCTSYLVFCSFPKMTLRWIAFPSS